MGSSTNRAGSMASCARLHAPQGRHSPPMPLIGGRRRDALPSGHLAEGEVVDLHEDHGPPLLGDEHRKPAADEVAARTIVLGGQGAVRRVGELVVRDEPWLPLLNAPEALDLPPDDARDPLARAPSLRAVAQAATEGRD